MLLCINMWKSFWILKLIFLVLNFDGTLVSLAKYKPIEGAFHYVVSSCQPTPFVFFSTVSKVKGRLCVITQRLCSKIVSQQDKPQTLIEITKRKWMYPMYLTCSCTVLLNKALCVCLCVQWGNTTLCCRVCPSMFKSWDSSVREKHVMTHVA